MGLSLSYIKRNLDIYLTTILILLSLSALFFFVKYWNETSLYLSSSYSHFITPQSLIVKKETTSGTGGIDIITMKKIEKILSDYDSSIRNISYRLKLYGISKYQERESQFFGIGVSFQRDEEFLNRYIDFIGETPQLKSLKNRIFVSSTLADRLHVEIGSTIDIYLLNRDSEKLDYEIINSASYKIGGLFREKFKNRELILFPAGLAESVVNSSEFDEVVIEFYTKEDRLRYRDELEKKLSEIGLYIKDIEDNSEREKMEFEIGIFYLFLLFFVLLLSYRDVSILIERRREDMGTLINYGWTNMQIAISNIREVAIFHLITYIAILGILMIAIQFVDIYPQSNPIVELPTLVAPIVGTSLLVHMVWYLFFTKFER